MDAARDLSLDIWTSFASLPTWVQVWVTWLVGVNLASLGHLDHPSGRTTATGLLGWAAPNLVLLVAQRGLGKVLSIPHLLVYPLLIVLLTKRMLADDASDRERRFARLVIVTNAISVSFDIMDAAAWVRGDRDVAGLEAA